MNRTPRLVRWVIVALFGISALVGITGNPIHIGLPNQVHVSDNSLPPGP